MAAGLREQPANDMETLTMSRKERAGPTIMTGVTDEELTLVQAAELMGDDAANRMRARLCEEETTRASYDVLAGWIRKHGLPPACMWTGTASPDARESPASRSNWPASSPRRSLGGRRRVQWTCPVRCRAAWTRG